MKKVILFLGMSVALMAEVPQVVSDSGCMSCHQVMGTSGKAPAFRGIARKNSRWYGESAKDKIMESIAKGSKGKYPRFNNTPMPSHPSLNQAQLEEIATWILSSWQGGNGRGMGRGNGGMGNGMGNGMGRGNGM